MKVGVVGFGAFSREIIPRLKNKFDIFVSNDYLQKINTPEMNLYLKKYNASLLSINNFDEDKYEALITLTNGREREKIINILPKNTKYFTFIDEKATVFDADNVVQEGSIICAGSVITTNVKISKFSHINLNSTIGHDVRLNEFVTCAPGVNISGRCYIGKYSYLGTNSSIKENINIENDVIIGAQSVVVKHILNPGVYAGIPAKQLK